MTLCAYVNFVTLISTAINFATSVSNANRRQVYKLTKAQS